MIKVYCWANYEKKRPKRVKGSRSQHYIDYKDYLENASCQRSRLDVHTATEALHFMIATVSFFPFVELAHNLTATAGCGKALALIHLAVG
jgi:hypothetical protein